MNNSLIIGLNYRFAIFYSFFLGTHALNESAYLIGNLGVYCLLDGSQCLMPKMQTCQVVNVLFETMEL